MGFHGFKTVADTAIQSTLISDGNGGTEGRTKDLFHAAHLLERRNSLSYVHDDVLHHLLDSLSECSEENPKRNSRRRRNSISA